MTKSKAFNNQQNLMKLEAHLAPSPRKMIVNIEIETRKSGRAVWLLKWLVIACRIYILVSPSLTINHNESINNFLIYEVNFFCSIIVLGKILAVLKKKRRLNSTRAPLLPKGPALHRFPRQLRRLLVV